MTYSTKAEQKRDLENLNHQFRLLNNILHQKKIDICLKADPTGGEKYWELVSSFNIPHNLHQMSDKVISKLEVEFKDEMLKVRGLLLAREEIKNTPIVKMEPQNKFELDLVDRAMKSLKELMDYRQVQFERGIELVEIFGELPVTANVHWVTNQHGTHFMRVFWYMAGEFTPFQVISAAAQAAKQNN